MNLQPRGVPTRPPEPSAVRQAAAAVVRRRADRPALYIAALGDLYLPLLPGCALLGGGVRLLGAQRSGLAWAIDLLCHHGSDRLALGTVQTDLLTVGALLLHRRSWQRDGRDGSRDGLGLHLHLGGGLRGGAGRLSGTLRKGTSAVGGTVWGPTLGLCAAAGLDVRVSRSVAGAAIEAGHVLVPVVGRVAGAAAAGMEGPWLGLRLGIGIAP